MAEFWLNSSDAFLLNLNTTLFTTCNTSCANTTTVPVPSEHTIYDDVLSALKYINIFLLPTCLVFGVMGNFVTMVVMNTKSFSTLTSKYFLIALAISDNILLLTQPLNQLIVISMFGRDVRALSNIGCKLYFWFFKNGKMTSSWFVVFLCIERFVAVQFPFKVKSLFCKRNCLIGVTAVYLVMAVYNGVWSWAHNIMPDGYCYPDGFDKTNADDNILFKNMLIAGSFLYSIVPIFIMATITPMIIAKLGRRSKLRKKLTRGTGKELELVRASTMLLSIVITYIICVAPVTALHLISFFSGFHAFGNNPKPFLIFRDISQILEQLNYTVNFFLYVASNRQFRQSVVRLFNLQKSPCCTLSSKSRKPEVDRKSTSFKMRSSFTSDYVSSNSFPGGTESTENK